MVYVVARPMLGVCMADVTILDRISDLWEEQAYIDNQQHMPCPEKLSDFTLPNGLTVKAIDPINHYRVEYQGIDDTWFKLDYHALHTAYDITTRRSIRWRPIGTDPREIGRASCRERGCQYA